MQITVGWMEKMFFVYTEPATAATTSSNKNIDMKTFSTWIIYIARLDWEKVIASSQTKRVRKSMLASSSEAFNLDAVWYNCYIVPWRLCHWLVLFLDAFSIAHRRKLLFIYIFLISDRDPVGVRFLFFYSYQRPLSLFSIDLKFIPSHSHLFLSRHNCFFLYPQIIGRFGFSRKKSHPND